VEHTVGAAWLCRPWSCRARGTISPAIPRRRPMTPIPCPACGSPDTIPIVDGMPASDPAEDPAWAGLYSDGCVVRPEDRFCRACEHAFMGASAGATNAIPA